MGAGNSTYSNVTNNIVNKTLNDISSSIKNTCKINTTNQQKIAIKLSNIRGCKKLDISRISQAMNNTAMLDCKNTSLDQTTLKNDLATKLDAAAKSVQDSPFFSFGNQSVAIAVNNALSEITNRSNIEKIAENIMNTLNNQDLSIEIDNYRCRPYMDENGKEQGAEINISDLNQDIINNIVAKAISENTNIMEAINKIDNEAKVSASATSLGLTSVLLGLFIPLIIIIFIVIIYKVVTNSKSSVKGILGMKDYSTKIAQTTGATGVGFGKSVIESSTFKIVFFAFIFSALSIAIGMGIQSSMLYKFSKDMYIYYALMTVYVAIFCITCGLFIAHINRPSGKLLAFVISGVVITAVLGITCISIMQVDIDKYNEKMKRFEDSTKDL